MATSPARNRYSAFRVVAWCLSTAALVAASSSCGWRDRENRASDTTEDQHPSTTAETPKGDAASPPHECTGTLSGPATHQYRSTAERAPINQLSLDVYRRTGTTNCPVIVWVHGGGWRGGDKANSSTDTKVEFAGRLGAALVAVNYRLVAEGNDVRWPTMGVDVAAAIDWVADHAVDLGIDADRIALVGHSAGAHLVTAVATNPSLLGEVDRSRADIRCVISLDSAAYEISLAQTAVPLYRNAFGTDPATLADASPLVQVRRHPDDVADMLVVTRGSRARVAEAEQFAGAVAASGSAGELVDAGNYTHADVNTRFGDDTDTVVTPPSRRFLRTCFE